MGISLAGGAKNRPPRVPLYLLDKVGTTETLQVVVATVVEKCNCFSHSIFGAFGSLKAVENASILNQSFEGVVKSFGRASPVGLVNQLYHVFSGLWLNRDTDPT